MTHQTDCQSLVDSGMRPCTCAGSPPPTPLTREKVLDHLAALGSLDAFPLRLPRCREIANHDAAQRETITRLEGELAGKERAGTVLVEKISELHARLTANEERIHSITESVLTTFKWELNLDSGGKDGPIFRRKDWQTSFEPVVYAMTIEEIIQQGLPTRQAKRKWTRERPKEAGWYWFKDDCAPLGSEAATEKIYRLVQGTFDKMGQCELWVQGNTWVRVRDMIGSWQGPLTPGEE